MTWTAAASACTGQIFASSAALSSDVVAYVEQDSPTLAGTLRENLLYSAPDATDEATAEVLRKTLLDELVAGLTNGLGTEVGSRGLALSGGERQRLAIARVLLREPQVLLRGTSSTASLPRISWLPTADESRNP